jgi:hypothetical protein
MKKTESKQGIKAITRVEKSNKLSINMIKLLIPNLEKSFYLNIIINNSLNLRTKLLDFKKGNLIELNQIFEFEQNLQSIETIKFHLSEKNSIFSNVVYKGEYSDEKKYIDKTTNCNLCFLSNNEKENCIVVYFRYELNVDLIDNFDDNLKTLNESVDTKTKTQQHSTFENLKDIASGENAANFTQFVKNIDYFKYLINEIISFLYWKDKWKTLSVAFFISLFFLFTNFSFCISPLFIIFLHVYNRKNLSDLSFKGDKYDNLENVNFIMKLIELTNYVVELYENFIEAMQHCEKNIIEDIYLNFIKLIFFNCVIFYCGFFTIALAIKIMLVVFWTYLLWNYPPFQAFCKFLFNFVLKKFWDMNQNSLKLFITNYFNKSNSEYLGINASRNNYTNNSNSSFALESRNSFSQSTTNNVNNNSNPNASSLPLSLSLVNQCLSSCLTNLNQSNLENYLLKTRQIISFLFTKAFSLIPFARLILFIITYDSSLNSAPTSASSVSAAAKDKKAKFDFNDLFKNINSQISTDPTAKAVNIHSDITSDLSCKSQTLKYELYENERWWMFVGWAKNLISNERPTWSDNSGKNYNDFKSVFLPGINYQWIGNWTIELTEGNDDEGWEYASDFNSNFSLSSFSKYVRRRKWVRYAKVIDGQ